jgi:hypothetical protein
MGYTKINASDRVSDWLTKSNQISKDLGDVSQLDTVQDSDLVGAINELHDSINQLNVFVDPDTPLNTSATTVSGAINELDTRADSTSSNLSILNGDRDSAASNLSILNGDRDSAAANLSILNGDRDSADANIQVLNVDRDSAAAAISQLSSDRDSAASNLSTLNADRDSASTNLSTLNADRDSAASNLSTLNADRDSAATNISLLNSRVDSIDGEVNAITGALADLADSIDGTARNSLVAAINDVWAYATQIDAANITSDQRIGSLSGLSTLTKSSLVAAINELHDSITDVFDGTGNISVNTLVVGGGYGSTGVTIASNGDVSANGNLIVGGNLTVSGITTTVNTETVTIQDNIILLNSNSASTPIENAGLEVERGDSPNVQLIWNETSDRWTAAYDGDNNISPIVTEANLTAGNNGIAISGSTISHKDTSSQASVNNSGRTYVQDIALDSFGHITSITSATETYTYTLPNATTSVKGGVIVGTNIDVSTGTISVATATKSAKGLASFDSADFTVSSGAVSIKSGGVSNTQLANSSITINSTAVSLGGSGTITANTPNALIPGSYLTGDSFNGSADKTWAVNATSANTGSTVVARDELGNFNANLISASLSGNATTATRLANARTFSLTGDVTATGVSFNGSANVALTTAIAAGTVSSTELASAVSLQILSSTGTVLKTIYGAGS